MLNTDLPLPLLFTLPPSNRHDFIILDTTNGTPSLKSLNQRIIATIEESPNCVEYMAHHKPKPAPTSASPTPLSITQLRMHWDNSKTRDPRIWPEYTIVTEENLGAILAVLRADVAGGGRGRGVLEVRVRE